MSDPRARGVLAGAALLLAFLAAGGGGRDATAALAWQLAAVVLLALVAARPRDAAMAGARRATAVLVAVLAVSALQADRSEASREQALAWILAAVPAVALACAGRRLAQADRGAVDRAVLAASALLLVVQAFGVLGLPLLGTAGGVGLGRPLGTFFDPNHLAAVLVLVAAIHAPLAGRAGWARAHLAVASCAGAAALATRSRVAVLSVGALLVAEAWRRHAESAGAWSLRSPRVRAALAGLLVLVGLAAARAAWSRRGEADAWARPAIWRGALPAVAERPLLGLGPAGFQSEWPRFQQPLQRGLSRHAKLATTPHGEWLRLPIEIGLLGVAALAWVVVAVTLAGRARDVVPLAAAATPLLLVHDALHAPATLAWLACGLALPAARREARLEAEPRGALVPALGLALVAALVVRVQVSQRLLERAIATGDAAALAASFALEPRDVEALLLASELAGRSGAGAAAGALHLADEAARLAPRDAEAALQVARCRAQLALAAEPRGPVASALAAYEHAGRLAPHDAWRRAEAAGVAARGGDPAAALAFAESALAIEPHLARARAWAVVALGELGRGAEADAQRALLEADRAVAADPALTTPERALLELEPALAAAAGLR